MFIPKWDDSLVFNHLCLEKCIGLPVFAAQNHGFMYAGAALMAILDMTLAVCQGIHTLSAAEPLGPKKQAMPVNR